MALNDALFPFVRQFANHDREWFDSQIWSKLHSWLEHNLESEEFKICMKKYPQWIQEKAPLGFESRSQGPELLYDGLPQLSGLCEKTATRK